MRPEAILLSIRDRLGEGSYRFSCPSCLGTVEKPADRKIVALLLSAGVELAEEAAPEAGPVRPLEVRPPGPPFTVEDLLAFRALLQDDARLARSIPTA
jgi:hypothetical protein